MAPQSPLKKPVRVDIHEFRQFDYVIVGGGTAGLACAAALSENKNLTVGVLEAGAWRPDDPNINTPALMGKNLMDAEYDWCFKSTPQKHSNDREWILPRGKVLGGSSALNFLTWQRGFKKDFDDIAQLGNPEWSWSQLTPYFYNATSTMMPSMENQKDHYADLTDNLHGTKGPLDISHAMWYSDLHKPWFEMHERVGVNISKDGSGTGAPLGVWNSLLTIDPHTCTRSHAGTAFHGTKGNFSQRENFKVLTEAHAVRIVLEDVHSSEQGAKVRASGVEFLCNGLKHVVHAKREVILSAGSYLSPQLLELSGIGNDKILRRAGLEVRVSNQQVGENLQEHFYAATVFEVDDNIVTLDRLNDANFAQQAMVTYGADKTIEPTGGILGSSAATAFSYRSFPSLLDADVFASMKDCLPLAGLEGGSGGMKQGIQMQMEKILHSNSPAIECALIPAFLSTAAEPEEGKSYMTTLVLAQYPLSRGSVHIQNNDPMCAPRIDPRFFESPADLRFFAHALKAVVEQIRKDNGSLGKLLKKQVVPDPGQIQTIKDYEEFAKDHCSTTYHPIGTCAMMPQSHGGVVDQKLRVYGTENIRVADASIIPLMPSGHIVAACYVIGFKAADLIQEQFSTPTREKKVMSAL